MGGFLTQLIDIAGPIVGGYFGGPWGAAAGGFLAHEITGDNFKNSLTAGAEAGIGSYLFSGSALGGGSGGSAGADVGTGATIGSSELTPAAIESATGTPGYGPNASASDYLSGGQPGAPGATPGSQLGASGGGGNGLTAMQQLSSYLQRASNIGSGSLGGGGPSGGFFGGSGGGSGGGGLGLNSNTLKTLAGLYELIQARSLQQQAKLPSAASLPGTPGYQAGQDAVRASMASQGYAGSTQMASALAAQAGGFYNQNVQQRQGSVASQTGPALGGLAGLGLLSSGLFGN